MKTEVSNCSAYVTAIALVALRRGDEMDFVLLDVCNNVSTLYIYIFYYCVLLYDFLF